MTERNPADVPWADPKAFAEATAKTEILARNLDITNADHVTLWLECNIEDMAGISWLAVRIVEAHEAEIERLRAALQQSRSAVIEECAKAIEDDATKCDCAAFSASECNCGSWEDYKRITSARAAEIVRALSQESADEG